MKGVGALRVLLLDGLVGWACCKAWVERGTSDNSGSVSKGGEIAKTLYLLLMITALRTSSIF